MNLPAGIISTAAPRAAAVLRAVERLPLVTLGIVLCALLLAVFADAGRSLAYAPRAPSLHTWLLCHVVHFSQTHLLWDVLTFGALGIYSEHAHRVRYVAFLACAVVLVPPLACALEPWVRLYAGLSGLVIGQVALGLAISLRAALCARVRERALAAALLLALLCAKQLYEVQLGNTSLIAIDYQGFATVPAAHLVSALVGGLLGLLTPATRPRDAPARVIGTNRSPKSCGNA